MKILACDDGRGTMRDFREKALEDLGHNVKIFNWVRETKLNGLSWTKRLPIFYHFGAKRGNIKLKNAVKKFKPDLFLNVGAKEIFPQTVSWIKEKFEIPTVIWYPDDPQRFEKISQYISPVHDYIFSSSFMTVKKYKNLGVSHAEYIPFGCRPEAINKVKLTKKDKKKYGCDVSFAGNYNPLREKILKFIIESDLDLDIKIYGKNWKYCTSSKVKKHFYGFCEDLYKNYKASQINLNIHTNQMKYGGMKANGRNFEVTACGSFLLTDKPFKIEDLFEVGKEIEVYETKKDLIDKIDYYLNNPEERENIAEAGEKRSREDHTVKKRMKHIIDTICKL